MKRTASACGKIILSGEYAVVFGKPGIAMPSNKRVNVSWTEDKKKTGVEIVWPQTDGNPEWRAYTEKILHLLEATTGPLKGTLTIKNDIPLGKGMGSSTALVIALCRCFLSVSAKPALAIENEMTPGNSGLDFAVIWEEKPILFEQGKELHIIDLAPGLFEKMELLDTGTPNETTAELVAWVKERYSKEADVKRAIETIGECTKRLVKGEDIRKVMHDHHRAQIVLGVVPDATQKIIAEIEAKGGSAKVIGAGGRTGGGGMVLALF